ncbi:MAG: methyltransferase, partial [Planctomycetes bacterium]|nr:methyltransferase [Planctomycetota bacterium]
GKQGACLEANHAIIYPGPWKEVSDDDGHSFRRGVREAVCEKTFRLMTSEPYLKDIIAIPPYQAVEDKKKMVSDCEQRERPAAETKNGPLPSDNQTVNGCCSGSSCC